MFANNVLTILSILPYLAVAHVVQTVNTIHVQLMAYVSIVLMGNTGRIVI